jgi:hypothetical protein
MTDAHKEAERLIRTLSRGIPAALAAHAGKVVHMPDLWEGLEKLGRYLETLDPNALPKECDLDILRRLNEEFAPFFGKGAHEFYAKVAEEAADPRPSASMTFPQAVGQGLRKEVATRPRPDRIRDLLRGYAAGHRAAAEQDRLRSSIARRMVGEATRTKVQAELPIAEAECRARQGGKKPKKDDIASCVGQKLGMSTRSVERHAPRKIVRQKAF